MLNKVFTILEMIKFQHTIFALPFAIMSAFCAARGLPPTEKIVWILVAMVGARSAAMAFNRVVDAEFDARNPRTSLRAIPRGLLSKGAVALFTVAMAALFVFSAAMLNQTCLILSPLALLVTLGYSYTKRFTLLSHFVLGLGLAIAPAGAWLAIVERLDPLPLILSAGVLFWVGGFDIIYACADIRCDIAERLCSIPAKFGIPTSLALSAVSHLIAASLFTSLFFFSSLGVIYLMGCILMIVLLIYEHIIVKPGDINRLNEAFFIVNAAVGIILMASALLDLYLT